MKDYKGREFLIPKKHYPAGTVLCKQGEMSDDIYLLQRGSIQVIVDQEVIQIIEAHGSFVGETACLLKQPRSASLIVKEDAECMVIPGEYLENVISQSPKVGINLLKVMCTRLLRTTKLLTQAQKKIVSLRNQMAGQTKESPDEKTTPSEPSGSPKTLGDRLIEIGLLNRTQLANAKAELLERSSAEPNLTLSQLLIEKGYLTSFQLSMFLQSKEW